LFRQVPWRHFSTFVARVDGRADDHLAAIREAIRSVDPYVPVFGVKTMEQRLADFFIRPRAYRTAVWMFAGFRGFVSPHWNLWHRLSFGS
jgi:hypothetical protein